MTDQCIECGEERPNKIYRCGLCRSCYHGLRAEYQADAEAEARAAREEAEQTEEAEDDA